MQKSSDDSWDRWRNAVETSALIVGAMIAVALLNRFLPIDLRRFGILPRTPQGVIGIFVCPLLHMGYKHLCANAAPLFILLILLFSSPQYRPKQTLMWIWFGSGFGTWLIGRGLSVHIGASSLIYGLVTYLIATGWWMRNWRSIVVAWVVLILYGGIFYGVLPQRGIVSWEGHLAGAIAGWIIARSQHA